MTHMNIDELVRQPPYQLPRAEREPVLLERLNELTRFHLDHCPPYRRLLGLVGGSYNLTYTAGGTGTRSYGAGFGVK